MPLSTFRHPLAALVVLAAALTLASLRSGGDAGISVVTTIDTIPPRFDTVGARVDTSPATLVVRNAGGTRLPSHSLVPEVRIEPGIRGASSFRAIDDIAPRPDGGAYLWDRATATVGEYDAGGLFVRQVGRQGSGPGEYDDPAGMLVVDGMLVILDRATHRVIVFDSAGSFRVAWPVPNPDDVSALHRRDATSFHLRQQLADTAYVAGVATAIGYVAYRWDGTPAGDTVPLPAFPDERRFTLQTASANRYVVRELPFAARLTVALSPRGDLVGGTGSMYRLDVVRRDAMPMQIERDVAAVPATLGERTDSARVATAEMQSVDPSWRWHGPGITHSKPFFRHVLFDDTGRIWVERALPSVRVRTKGADDRARGDDASVVWREDLTYDIFDPAGRLEGVVTPPAMSRILHIAGDQVWGIQGGAGEKQKQALVRWRLATPQR